MQAMESGTDRAPPQDLERMCLQVATLYVLDDAGRLLTVNAPGQREAPRFFLGRTAQGNVWRWRHDLPDALAQELDALARAEPVCARLGGDLPVTYAAIRQRLQAHAPVRLAWRGPAYAFPDDLPAREPPAHQVVAITATNADVLVGPFAGLRASLAAVQPCVAVVEGGAALAVCHCSRRTDRAAEAGVETRADARRRGSGAAVVAAWAAAVRQSGRTPLYSTSWGNAASQALARRLGLAQYGEDVWLL
jgi:hypothetical protein